MQGGAGSPSPTGEQGILRTPKAESPSSGRSVRQSLHIAPSITCPQAENEACRPHHFQPKPKIKLNMFNGINARYWVRKCNRYFGYYNTIDRDKDQVAALYFDEKVEKWFNNYLVGKPYVTWEELSRALLAKYDKLDDGHIIGVFNKLRQTWSLVHYIDTFEDLRASMLEFNPMLTESHFMHNFISGLQDEMRHSVVMFKPKNLKEVYHYKKTSN